MTPRETAAIVERHAEYMRAIKSFAAFQGAMTLNASGARKRGKKLFTAADFMQDDIEKQAPAELTGDCPDPSLARFRAMGVKKKSVVGKDGK